MDTKRLNQNVTDITNLGFDKVWQGPSYEKQSEELNELMTMLNDVIKQLDKFNGTLEKRDKYIEICKAISNLVGLRSEYDPDKPDEKPQYNSYTTVINGLENDRKALRSEIISELSEYTGIDAEISPMMDLQTPEVIFLFDFEDLYNRYHDPNNVLAVNSEGLFSLYNIYDENGNLIMTGEEYVNERIADVVSQCRTEREIAVNLSGLIMKLAADKGVKLKYENEGAQGALDWGLVNYEYTTREYTYKDGSGYNPNIVYNSKYNNITQIHEGMDCCAWVSYLINVAVSENPTAPNPEGFNWEGVPGLYQFGEKIPITSAKAGDVYIWSSDGQKTHTGMIISVTEDPNNPGSGEILVSESGGQASWLAPNKYRYTTKDGKIYMGSNETYILDYDKVYNGEQKNHEFIQGYHPENSANN